MKLEPVAVKIACAYLLDLAVGDPRWLPHPVRGLGWVIRRGESFFRARVKSERRAGAALTLSLIAGAWFSVKLLLDAATGLAPWLGWAVEVAVFYTCFSTRDLAVESWPVYRALRKDDLEGARKAVRMIVGRDTDRLDEREVTRAALETIAESIMDGIVAPLFYAALGGAPLCFVYKAVNTLDSMVGYRSARYIRFGRVPAAVDRWMNAVPAWLTALLISAAGWLLGFRGTDGLRAVVDSRVQAENSFVTEAAMAGVLGVRLGGVNHYEGKPVSTPSMGTPIRRLRKERIPEAIRVMYASSALALAAAFWVRHVLAKIAK
ncbi:MAG: cobalamin biosynthesis protein CobD [Candidatus Omnitrophica bacterium]|nr:cobalamin biosynthesis protein CobD [Candidatus Omnitrophota bacterium]